MSENASTHTPTLPDSAARIDRLVADNGSLVERTLRRYGVAQGDVDDAAQRVFLTAVRRLDSIEVGQERAFLRAVATREAAHVRRTYRRRREDSDTTFESELAESVRPDMLTVRKARATTLAGLLGSMESDLRSVLHLVELEGHAIGDAAQDLGIPVGTCKSRLRRARAVLSVRIEALPDSVRALVRS